MAGDIYLDGKVWSASSWLFDYVVERIADEIGESQLSLKIRDIITNNLGLLKLADFGPNDQRLILAAISERLVSLADRDSDPHLANRREVLARIADLVTLGRATA
jgi:hypothetical protein